MSPHTPIHLHGEAPFERPEDVAVEWLEPICEQCGGNESSTTPLLFGKVQHIDRQMGVVVVKKQ